MNNQPIRIPNLPIGKMVEQDGNPTQQELTFRQNLITSLNNYVGSQGLVAPSQTTDNINTIETNTSINPSTGKLPGPYTCQPGTIIYNTDTDTLMVAILVAGVPTFKTFTVT